MQRKLITACVLCFMFMCVEIVGGWFAHRCGVCGPPASADYSHSRETFTIIGCAGSGARPWAGASRRAARRAPAAERRLKTRQQQRAERLPLPLAAEQAAPSQLNLAAASQR